MPKILRNHKAQFPNVNVFVSQKSIVQHYYIHNVKDGIQIRVYEISKESETHLSQFVAVKVRES